MALSKLLSYIPPGLEVCISVDNTQVHTEPDGSIIVGDRNAPVTIRGEAFLELLTANGACVESEEQHE